jgi:predicted dehydrogenase
VVRVGVIGYGYWGPNLVRNFSELPDAQMLMLCDLRPERLALASSRYPRLETTASSQTLINDSRVDAVAIATSVSTHFPLAMAALQAGKHVLLEKPLTSSSDDAQRLIDEAQRRKRVLMVDHTFVYTGAVRKICDLVDKKELGDIYYYDAVRVNLGLFQRDVNVIWDLAVHDLSIMDYVLKARPTAVAAVGMGHVPSAPENIAYLTLFFDNMMGHVHVNWLAPVKIRRTLIGGSQKMVVFDDLEPSEKVKVYGHGVTVDKAGEAAYATRISYRMGDMWAPRLDASEPLKTEVTHFVRCIEHGETPLTDGLAGLRIVRILEAATQSMKEQGRPAQLPKEG